MATFRKPPPGGEPPAASLRASPRPNWVRAS